MAGNHNGGGADGVRGVAPAPVGRGALSRRTVLKLGVVGIIGAAVGAGSTAAFARLARTAQPRYRFFSEAEAGLLVDICEQIIPRDDVPGATDTGAIQYIDRQLCGALRRHRATARRCCTVHRCPARCCPVQKP